MNNLKIGFTGGGNMASSLIGGLIADGHPPHLIRVSEPDEQRRSMLAAHGVESISDNLGIASWADVLVLAVKPQIMKAVCLDIAPGVAASRALVVSVAAGIPVASMEQWLGQQTAIVRCMPNTPAMVQSGATGLFANAATSTDQKNAAECLLRSVGLALWLKHESLMDAVTAVSGSGPAYYFLFMEAMEQAAVDLGLDEETARLLTGQTILGASRMAMESDVSPAELRRRVTSPGGTTEQAIRVFEEHHLQQTIKTAMEAAYGRAKAMAEELGA